MTKIITLGQLGKIITGNTPPRNQPDYYGNGTIFIKPTDISETSKYTYSPEESYSEKGAKKYRASLIPKGATCVVTIGTIGKKMTMAHTECFINQAMNAIIPNEDYDIEYVYYLLKNNLMKLKSLDSGTTSGRENVSKSAFSNMELRVIDNKSIQKRIGKLLSHYDDLIENNQKQIKLLEDAAMRLYKEWFVHLRFPGHETTPIVDGVPEGWENTQLKKHISVNPNSINQSYGREHIKYIDISSVSKGRVENKTEYLRKDAPGRAKRLATDGDTIWAMVRPNLKSYALILDPDDNDVFSTGFAILSPRSIPYSFLYCLVIQDEFVGYLINCTNGAAYPAVKPIHFEKYVALIPTAELLSQYHEITEPLFRKCKRLDTQISFLRQARDKLLPKLMNGEIEV